MAETVQHTNLTLIKGTGKLDLSLVPRQVTPPTSEEWVKDMTNRTDGLQMPKWVAQLIASRRQ